MKKIMIAHGEITHPASKWRDCKVCIQSQIEYLQELEKYNGETNFVKQLKKKIFN